MRATSRATHSFRTFVLVLFSFLALMSSPQWALGPLLSLTTSERVGVRDNTNAELVYEDRRELREGAFIEAVLWKLPRPIPVSVHLFKYRFVLVVDERCVMRTTTNAEKATTAIWGIARSAMSSPHRNSCSRTF